MSDIVTQRDVRIPTGRDGITLSADVVRPADDAAHPALITVLPYRNDAGGGLMMASELDWFARHGFASILLDPLGIGSSDGTQRRPFDAAEADDAVAAVNWAAAQTWCTGAVGMWGHSYGALMALRTAARAPQALRAIAPVQGMLDPERDFVHRNGVRGGLGPVPTWGLAMLVNQLLPPLRPGRNDQEQHRWRQRLNAEPWLLEMFRTPPGHPDWRARAIDPTQIHTPTLCVAGWSDLFCDATIRAFEQIDAPKKLIVGPWMHTIPHLAPQAAIDFHAIALRWWQHWLLGIDTGLLDEPSATVYIQGCRAGWRSYQNWPPRAETHPLDLGPAPGPMWPDHTVGADSGLIGMPAGFGSPLDQHDDDLRAISLTTSSLEHPLLLVGQPRVSVELPETPLDWVAVRLCAVDPAGRSTLLSSGTSRIGSGATELALTPVAYRVHAGDRLRVAIAAADFPRLWPQPVADPFTVGAVRVDLPAAHEGEGLDVAPDHPPADLPLLAELLVAADAQWTVAHDHAHAALTVTTGEANTTRTLTRETTVTLRFERSLSVARLDPASATAEASGYALVEHAGEAPIVVTARLAVHGDRLELTASVTAGAEIELFTGEWTAEAQPPA